MSAAFAHHDEPVPETDTAAEQPAESAVGEEPAPAPSEPPTPERPSAEPDGLVDEAPDADWVRENDRRSRQASEGLRSLGVDSDAPVRATRPLTGTRDRTGPKTAIGQYATSAEHVENHFTSAQPNRARGGLLPAELIESTVRTHVQTAEHDLLRYTLLQHGVAYESGRDGSGRLATAHALLAELCGCDKIVAIDLDDDADLSAVLDQDGVLLPGHGHVLELTADRPVPRKQTLAAAGGRLAVDQGYLIVIGPPGPADRPLDPYEVEHHPPGAAAVLDQHLAQLLRTRANWSDKRVNEFVSACRADEVITEQLRTSWRPGEVAQLVRRLVDVGRRGGRPAEAVELLPGALRELAVSVLRAANDDGDVTALRRLTARIAFGLYSGRPLAVVFELASLLFAALPPADPADPADPVDPAPLVFDGGMESLVDPRMRARPDGAETEDTERLARLVDPELALAVLDVVWHDYDHLRAPVLAWLRVLGGDPRQSVRMRTGQLAGQLALYDFGEAYRELLRPWASSERKVLRQSAAWAMERAVLEPRLTARVCRQVRDWTYSQHPFLNDTAARCYATRLGTEFADDTLVHLWLVALRGEQAVSPAVAQAVAGLYQPDQAESARVLLEELRRWTQDRARCLHVHAARALTFLAHRTAPSPDDRWPALLRLATEDTETWDLLTELWRATLTEPMAAARGWQVLLAWLHRPSEAGEPGELGEVTERFATDLLRAPVVRFRAQFHLTQWLARYPDLTVLRRLLDNLRRDAS